MQRQIIQNTFKRLISMTNNNVPLKRQTKPNKPNKPNVLMQFAEGLVIPATFFTVAGAGCYAVDRVYGIGQSK